MEFGSFPEPLEHFAEYVNHLGVHQVEDELGVSLACRGGLVVGTGEHTLVVDDHHLCVELAAVPYLDADILGLIQRPQTVLDSFQPPPPPLMSPNRFGFHLALVLRGERFQLLDTVDRQVDHDVLERVVTEGLFTVCRR